MVLCNNESFLIKLPLKCVNQIVVKVKPYHIVDSLNWNYGFVADSYLQSSIEALLLALASDLSSDFFRRNPV